MNTNELCEKLNLKLLTKEGIVKEISDGCVCDLLSWVMARGEENMVWVTVQTHLNVVAVACLHDFACVIIPEDIEVPQTTIDKANEEDIIIFGSEKTSYKICSLMSDLGIGK